jgi:hypothetical protein
MKLSELLGVVRLDDRGVPARMQGYMLHRWSESDRRSFIKATVGPFLRGWKSVFVIGATVASLIGLTVLFFVLIQAGLFDPKLGVAIILALLCVGFGQIFFPGYTFARKLSAWRLGRRACAACGYRLEGVLAEQDGCTVCPECGAAWKLESLDA